MEAEKVYLGIKKCITNDYPYDLNWDDTMVYPIFLAVYNKVIEENSHIQNSYYSNEGKGILRLEYLDHYVIICFRFANQLFYDGNLKLADSVYYSMRIRGNIDLFYRANIGEYFMPTHALGTVMDSHSTYGKLFKIYNGVHIGPYSIVGKEPSRWEHPKFGDFVTVLSHSKIFGNTKIGNNVIISSNSIIINEEIPDNCIVSGKSPDLYFLPLKIENSLCIL